MIIRAGEQVSRITLSYQSWGNYTLTYRRIVAFRFHQQGQTVVVKVFLRCLQVMCLVDAVFWARPSIYLEKEIIGCQWSNVLRRFDRDLPVAWADLSVADDLYEQMFQSKYWAWHYSVHRVRLFVLLHQQRWDDALEQVHSWTEKDINKQGLDEEPGKWTAQEELDNAIRLVTEYVDKHRK